MVTKTEGLSTPLIKFLYVSLGQTGGIVSNPGELVSMWNHGKQQNSSMNHLLVGALSDDRTGSTDIYRYP